MNHSFLLQSSVDGHFGSFHIFAIVDCAAVNIGAHVGFSCSRCFVYIPQSAIAGSYVM